MARAELNEIVLIGNPLRPGVGATVTVARRDGGTATIYSDDTGGTSSSNPLTADSGGRINGWLEEGSYTLSVVRGSQSYSQPFEAVVVRSRSSAAEGSGSVTVGTSSTEVVAENTNRAELTIANDSTVAVIYLGLGVAAALNAGVPLYPGSAPFVTSNFTGQVNAISTVAGTNVTLVEV